MVRRQVGRRVRQHRSSASRPTRASSATAKSARLGPFYLPAYANGVRAGIAELGPHLLGEDPLQLAGSTAAWTPPSRGTPTSSRASTWPAGTSWARWPASPFASCWADATARISCSIAPSRRSRRRQWPASVAGYRAEGYRRFQLKVGGDPDVDIERIRAVAAELQPGDRLIADANTGWLMHEAMRVVRAVRDVDVYIEQPCLTLRRMPVGPPAVPTIRSCSTK